MSPSPISCPSIPLTLGCDGKQMSLRKLFLSILLGAILILQSVSLGFSIVESARIHIAVYALHTAFALYLLVIAGSSVSKTYGTHVRAIIHLSVLTWIAVMLLGTTAILPSTPFPLAPAPSTLFWSASAAGNQGAALGIWYAVLALYVVALVVVVTTPRGPKLHFPSEAIYANKTLMQITSKYEDNVDAITGVFCFSSPKLRSEVDVVGLEAVIANRALNRTRRLCSALFGF